MKSTKKVYALKVLNKAEMLKRQTVQQLHQRMHGHMPDSV